MLVCHQYDVCKHYVGSVYVGVLNESGHIIVIIVLIVILVIIIIILIIVIRVIIIIVIDCNTI